MSARIVLFACLAVSCIGAFAWGEDGQSELLALQGAWKVSGLEIGGRVIKANATPLSYLDGFNLVVEGRRMSYFMVVSEKKVRVDFDVTLDSTKQPETIDARLLGGRWKGKTCLGIYELEGDTLRLCLMDNPSTPRPGTFSSKDGSLITLQRSKP